MKEREELKKCRFCGEGFQLQIIRVDVKNPGRDIVKCRKCRGEAPRKFWQSSPAQPQVDVDEVLKDFDEQYPDMDSLHRNIFKTFFRDKLSGVSVNSVKWPEKKKVGKHWPVGTQIPFGCEVWNECCDAHQKAVAKAQPVQGLRDDDDSEYKHKNVPFKL